MLRHQLAHVLPDGKVDYRSCFDQYIIETGLHKVTSFEFLIWNDLKDIEWKVTKGFCIIENLTGTVDIFLEIEVVSEDLIVGLSMQGKFSLWEANYAKSLFQLQQLSKIDVGVYHYDFMHAQCICCI